MFLRDLGRLQVSDIGFPDAFMYVSLLTFTSAFLTTTEGNSSDHDVSASHLQLGFRGAVIQTARRAL